MGQTTKNQPMVPEREDDWMVAAAGDLMLTLEPDASGGWVVKLGGDVISGPHNEAAKARDVFLTVRDAVAAKPGAAREAHGPSLNHLVDVDSKVAALPEGAPLPPIHPGEILLHEFIGPHSLSPIRVAQRLGVPRTRIERLVAGQVAMTEDTALRLERLFGASAEFWLGLQTTYDLRLARRRADPAIAAIAPLESPAEHISPH